MKKIKIIIVSIMCIALLLSTTSCNFYQKNSNDGSSGLRDPNATYVINYPSIQSYDEVTGNNVAEVVASIVMPATLIINAKLNFTYVATSGFGFGGYSREVSSSQSGTATCFLINEEGYLVTNAHVVSIENEANYRNLKYTSREIYVSFADTSLEFPATLIDYDVDLDLALLKMDVTNVENVPYLTFFDLTDPRDDKYETENAVKLNYGETAIVIGNANGYGISVTKGIISAPVRVFTSGGVTQYAIQTDAAINQGNSGGPLCNSYGAVIGINSFKIVTTTSESLGFAIPSYVIITYLEQLSTANSLNLVIHKTSARVYSGE